MQLSVDTGWVRSPPRRQSPRDPHLRDRARWLCSACAIQAFLLPKFERQLFGGIGGIGYHSRWCHYSYGEHDCRYRKQSNTCHRRRHARRRPWRYLQFYGCAHVSDHGAQRR
jgi:hypothetical protein